MLRLVLVSRDHRLCRAWASHFVDPTHATIFDGDIVQLDCDGVVTPLLSFDGLDDPWDAALAQRFGPALEARLRACITDRDAGRLHWGDVRLERTGDRWIPWVIIAPARSRRAGLSLEAPQLATAALLRAAQDSTLRPPITTIASPGLLAGTLPAEIVALQMWNAYCEVILGRRIRGPCYCRPGKQTEGLPPGFCGTCEICGAPGHVRHAPGGAPYTGAWCDRHYDELDKRTGRKTTERWRPLDPDEAVSDHGEDAPQKDEG